jgi:hypothetical protein
MIISTVHTVHGVLLKQEGSRHLMNPSYAGQYLSLENVPTAVWWTLFQLPTATSPSTTQALPFTRGKLPFCVRQLRAFQQRHYRPGNQLTRKISAVLSNNAIPFPIPLKCYLYKFQTCISLYLINYVLHRQDVCWSGGIFPPFLTSTLDGGERSAQRSGRFTPGERASPTHWTEG